MTSPRNGGTAPSDDPTTVFLNGFLSALSPDVAHSFSARQLSAIVKAFGPASTPASRPVALTLPTLWGSYSLTIERVGRRSRADGHIRHSRGQT